MSRTYMGMTGPHPAMPLLMSYSLWDTGNMPIRSSRIYLSQIRFQGCMYLLHNGSAESRMLLQCVHKEQARRQHLQGVHCTWNIMSCSHAHKLKLTMETAGAENRRGLCQRSAQFELLAPNSKQDLKYQFKPDLPRLQIYWSWQGGRICSCFLV